VAEPAKVIAAFGLAHRKSPLSQLAVLIPYLLRPDPRHDFLSIVEAIAEQAKRADLKIWKRHIDGMQRIAGIGIADSLRGKFEHHVQRHAVANRIAVNAKLDAELGADRSPPSDSHTVTLTDVTPLHRERFSTPTYVTA
jgi:hypothetical protein